MTSCLLAAFLLIPAAHAEPAPADRLDLRVKLDPPTQRLEVEAALTVRVPKAGTRELTWSLNRQFEVAELKGPLVADWTFTPDTGLLKVHFLRPVGPAAPVRLRLRYKGIFSKGQEHASSIITPFWTELDRTLPWFPLRQDNAPFTFRLEVRCRPEYALASYGPFLGWQNARTLAWNHPVTDLIIVAARKDRMQIWNLAPRVRFVSMGLGEAEASRLATAMGKLVTVLQRRLGPRGTPLTTLIQSPRAEGSNAAPPQPGLVVLEGLTYARIKDSLPEILQPLAVETARAWWCAAPVDSWEDWLNVSFADYSALTALRELLGEAAYQHSIELKRRACVGLPPLWEFDRNAAEAKPIMENKGVVLLAELEGFVGRERFEKFCRELAARKVTRTLQFLELLEAREGKSLREAFQRRLMSL